MSAACIIITVGLDETQRKLIHQQVKERAEDWWHEFPDLWVVVGGGSPIEWRDRLMVMTPFLPSGLLVFPLAGDDWPDRKLFAAKMDSTKTAWFTGKSAEKSLPKPEDPWAQLPAGSDGPDEPPF
jgi:hypothetical protein